MRHSDHQHVVVVLNMTPNVHHGYQIGVPLKGTYHEVLNSDKDIYFGSNIYNGLPLTSYDEPRHDKPYHISVTLGPLSMAIFLYQGDNT